MKNANKIVMAVVAAFLIVAATLKAKQILTEPILTKGFWESWLFLVIQIPLEFGLGIWLICGLFRKAAWLLATLAFGGFIIITGYKAISGEASCGCFGTVHINPWITLSTIDIPLFILLALFRPKGEKFLPPPWPSAKHFFSVAIPTVIFLAALVPVLVFNKPPEETAKYHVVRPGQWTTVKPVKPVKIVPPVPHVDTNTAPVPVIPEANTVAVVKPPVPVTDANTEPNKAAPIAVQPKDQWPMLKQIDIADSLRSGVVVVLLYHFDCPGCQEAIPKYDKLNRELAGNNDAIRFAFIAIPPYGDEKLSPIPKDTKCLTGKLISDKKEIMMTPFVVLLQDGAVVKAWEGKAPPLDELLNALTQ
jgi:thiol-disulfide isomerase/thioredoxin